MSVQRHRRMLAAGEILFREGEAGDVAYVIEDGRVEIYTGPANQRRVVARLGRDDILGEMALVGDQTRVASAVALEPTTLLTLTHGYLEERLQQAEPLLRHLLRVTINRCRSSMQGLGQPQPAAAAETPAAAAEQADRSMALERLRIEQSLESALENHEFQLHLQPIMRLRDGQTAGFEALIRWIRPDGTRVSPADFIPIAEQSDFIHRLGHWIIRSACAALRDLDRALPGQRLFMSLNLSIRQFADPQLFGVLAAAMEEFQVPPQRLRLEITESMIANNSGAALVLLRRCKALGAKLAVDDFGTGYSSLSYLQQFPVDTLKLDRSFIQEIATSEPALTIVRAISRLASELGMETVAEGVETAEQALRCREVGIDYTQGFHYSAALPAEKAARFVAERLRTAGIA